MRLDLLSIALLLFVSGCTSSNGEHSGAAPAGSPVLKSGSRGTAEWELPDKTILKVSLDPPMSVEVRLLVTRQYDVQEQGALDSLWYRVVTDVAPDAEWVLLEPSHDDVGYPMEKSTYSASLTLPKGASSIQFKIDDGFVEPYEAKGWNVEVE